jgi:hypothetical protein
VSVIILIIFFFAFVLLHAKKRSVFWSATKQAGFFVCLGLAFMMVEVLVLILGISIASLIPLLDTLKNHTDSFPLMVRCIMVGGMLFPFAFFMGMPFPLAIKLLPKNRTALVPWLWGLNGVASIPGSAVAVTLVLYLGYRITSLLPAALYCLAAAFVYWFNEE